MAKASGAAISAVTPASAVMRVVVFMVVSCESLDQLAGRVAVQVCPSKVAVAVMSPLAPSAA